MEFIRFRSADGERIRVLPELPEDGKIYQYISGLGEDLRVQRLCCYEALLCAEAAP